MIILLSNASENCIKKVFRRHSVKKWVYFGKNNRLAGRLDEMFGHTAVRVDYARRLYDLTRGKRADFINWIDDLSVSAKLKREWLFSMPAVKNTYSSNLFLYVCYFFVLENLIRDGERLDLVIVDSPALGLLFKRHFPEGTKLAQGTGTLVVRFRLRIFLRTFYRFIRFLGDALKRRWSAKKILQSRARDMLKGKMNLVLIRNFITDHFSCKDDRLFSEYYFPGLERFLAERGYSPVFLPMTAMVSDYDKLFREVKASRRNIIFADEFFRPVDYFHVMLCPFKALFWKIAPREFGGYDLTRLVREEYFSNITEFGVMMAALLFQFGERMREDGYHPVAVINWNENQAIEKGLISGLKQAFRDLVIIGTQPFISPPNHLSTVPSHQDKLSGILPDKMLVLGPAGRDAVKEFVKDIKIGFCPAFRYTNLLRKNPMPTRGNNLLVLFGYDFDNSLHILKVLAKAAERLDIFESVFMKIHPIGYFSKERLLKELGWPLPERFSFVDGKVEDYLDKVSVGICGATSAGIELMLGGIPAVVIGEERALTMNYLSYREDADMWRLCFTEEEVVQALEQFHSALGKKTEGLLQKSEEFRRAFFAEQKEQYWENYLVNN
ncbi:MAG: hypothetical protein WC552_07160 [Candidatus Omnitrophota bacterium]